ncbi:hypothetical protein [Streptomyces sp. SCL15-4]|uniref:hypothetical protein n=1 Tax=Streptomyces sp. SCL15-4 TaxID=2967221 RepID=UPI0029672388|nr:hypothetical protein [Streptomyces sp. SCL15-4]
MAVIEVPGPEPEWETAPSYQRGKRNPAFQESMWEFAASSFQLVAGLQPPLEALAARLRLTLERGWEDLGPVDVAMFRIERVDFALSRLEGAAVPNTFVWVSRSAEDVEWALDILLKALGLDRRALAFRGTVEMGFEVLDGSTG